MVGDLPVSDGFAKRNSRIRSFGIVLPPQALFIRYRVKQFPTLRAPKDLSAAPSYDQSEGQTTGSFDNYLRFLLANLHKLLVFQHL
jgi:hypothetical protein